MPTKVRVKITPPWGGGPPPPPQGTATGDAPQWEPNPNILTIGEVRTGIDFDSNLQTQPLEFLIKKSFATLINKVASLDDKDLDRDDDISRNVWKSVDKLEIACYHAIQALNF